MRQCLFPLLLAFTLLGSAAAQASTPRVCVAKLQTNQGTISPAAGQDSLIKFLSKQKSAQMEEVALDASLPNEAMTQAKDKKCDYVVDTDVTENHADSGYTGGFAGVNLQTFYVTVAYKLSKVDDGTEVSSGSFKASDRGSAQNAAIATTKKIAEKVAESVKTAK